jgi:hypothetical protein
MKNPVTGITSIGVYALDKKFYVWKSLGSNVNGVTAVIVILVLSE